MFLFSHDIGFVRYVQFQLTEGRTARNTHPSSLQVCNNGPILVIGSKSGPLLALLPDGSAPLMCIILTIWMPLRGNGLITKSVLQCRYGTPNRVFSDASCSQM